uniref:glycosyltransferase family 2 protein n=1 Tax=Bacteroides caecimuris TaxID=1796613 RepID=UPI0026E54C06
GNNIGLRYAADNGYEYAMIANPDMEFPDPHYVARLAEELSKRSDVVAIGSDIITPEGLHQNPMVADGPWTTSFGWIKELIGFRKQNKESYDFIDNYRESHQCGKLSGCCLMVRLPQLTTLGFFDEYPFLYCEEAIFAKQVEAAGFKMYYTAEIQAIHRHIASAKGDPRPRFRQWRRSRLYFIRKYSGYTWYGRILSSISWRVYTGLMIAATTIRGFK